jgi:peptide chain release factor 1
MAQPKVMANRQQLQSLAQERAAIEEVMTTYEKYNEVSRQLEETHSLLSQNLDSEMTALVKQEVANLETRREELMGELKLALLPRDPNDERDVIVEIRAAAGGEESSLFAADLFRMYSHYAQTKGWQLGVADFNESAIGGFKEVVFEVKGEGAYSKLKYERGVHRVQRVPVTEAGGRIHTSTATVAVLPQADEVEININPNDLKIDFFHSRGAGGQNVNKVATAVRITYLPTGIVATCQDERSQLKNKTKAMAVLRARLFDKEQRNRIDKRDEERRSQVGSGERAEKIRTYNFPQNRVTDHRIPLTLYNLPTILDGDLDQLIDPLVAKERTEYLEKSRR